VCVSGELKVRIYRVCVCIGGTEGTDIQGVCVSGELKVRIYRVCLCIGGTEGTDIQGVCVYRGN